MTKPILDRYQRYSPDLVTDELDRMLLALGEMPTLGTRYEAGTRTVRRLLLRRTHDHLYFVQEIERVYVLAVWRAFRDTFAAARGAETWESLPA